MQVNELPAAEAGRMRDKLTAVNAGIAKTVGQGTWDEVQAAVKQARAPSKAHRVPGRQGAVSWTPHEPEKRRHRAHRRNHA
jgi:hypothetical protein